MVGGLISAANVQMLLHYWKIEYFILYNIKLHASVVVELKATPFKPEYARQLNYYLNVVNDKLKGEHDNKSFVAVKMKFWLNMH
jgi:hypothetical protein